MVETLIKRLIINYLGENEVAGWGFAFKKGLIIWLFCILWLIVGAVVFIIISMGSLLPFVNVMLNPTPETFVPEAFIETMPRMIIVVLAGSFIGSLIAVIGIFTSIVKVITDAVEEQTHKRNLAEAVREPPVPAPPSIANYCPNCGRQIGDPSVVYCPDCGAKVTE